MKTVRDFIQIVESPQLICDYDFNMSDDFENQKKLAELKSKNPVKVYDFGGYPVWQTGMEYFAEYDGELAYWIKTELKKLPILEVQAVSQSCLWRDMATIPLANLASEIFFEVLLPKYGVIATDTMHTPAGRRFWILRLTTALKSGLHCYYIGDDCVEIKDVSALTELDRQGILWGDEEKYQDRKLVIANRKLVA